MKKSKQGFGKKEVYANPQAYEYTKLAEVKHYLYLQDGEVNEVISTNMKPGKDASEVDLIYKLQETNGSQIVKHSITDIQTVEFSTDKITIHFSEHTYTIEIKNEIALKSFLSFIKIPYGSFYKTNKSEINKDLITKFLTPEFFKDPLARLEISFQHKNNQILYVIPAKKTYLMDEKYSEINLEEEFNKYENFEPIFIDEAKDEPIITVIGLMKNEILCKTSNSMYEKLQRLEINTAYKTVMKKGILARNVSKGVIVSTDMDKFINVNLPSENFKQDLSLIIATKGFHVDSQVLSLTLKYMDFYSDRISTFEDFILFTSHIAHTLSKGKYMETMGAMSSACILLLEQMSSN